MSRIAILRSVSDCYARLDASWRDRWAGVCRRCSYPVRGLPGPSPRCPECGDSVGSRRDLWEDGRHTLGVATGASAGVGIAIGLAWTGMLGFCLWSISTNGVRPSGGGFLLCLGLLALASLAGLVVVMRLATLHTRDLRHACYRWLACASACLIASWLVWSLAARLQVELLFG